MKNLILKNRSKTEKVARWLLVLFFLFSLFFLFNLFYNQNKNILASEEEIDYGKLQCSREIPVGEAMEKTGELLEGLIWQLESIDENAYFQIQAAKEMIELSDKCDINECKPQNCGCCGFDEYGNCIACCSPPCTSPWLCHGIYRACPQCEINAAFEKVSYHYDKIEIAKKEIWALIDGEDNGVDRRESLCDKLNEDIRTLAEKGLCLGCPLIPNPACPKITIIEAIERKLNRARDEFDKCYISPEDWKRIEEGEKTGKFLFNCPIVAKEDYPRYTKTIENDIPVCTSLNNWFCCLDVSE